MIDFADAVQAPVEYEHAIITAELFAFDPDRLRGYFGAYRTGELSGMCLDGLLIHDFGANVIQERVCVPETCRSIAVLKNHIYDMLQ